MNETRIYQMRSWGSSKFQDRSFMTSPWPSWGVVKNSLISLKISVCLWSRDTRTHSWSTVTFTERTDNAWETIAEAENWWNYVPSWRWGSGSGGEPNGNAFFGLFLSFRGLLGAYFVLLGPLLCYISNLRSLGWGRRREYRRDGRFFCCM